jgi:hypothetical protein
MANTDYNICLLYNTGKTTDAFACADGSFDAQKVPVAAAETQDVKLAKTTSLDLKTGTFSVNFQRALIPTDVAAGRDFNLTLNETDFIWAYKQIAGGVPSQHDNDDRGAITFNVGTGQIVTAASAYAGFAAPLFVAICSLFLLFA